MFVLTCIQTAILPFNNIHCQLNLLEIYIASIPLLSSVLTVIKVLFILCTDENVRGHFY